MSTGVLSMLSWTRVRDRTVWSKRSSTVVENNTLFRAMLFNLYFYLIPFVQFVNFIKTIKAIDINKHSQISKNKFTTILLLSYWISLQYHLLLECGKFCLFRYTFYTCFLFCSSSSSFAYPLLVFDGLYSIPYISYKFFFLFCTFLSSFYSYLSRFRFIDVDGFNSSL